MKRNAILALLVGVVAVCSLAGQAAESCQTALLVVDVQSDILAFGAQNMQTVFKQPILERVEAVVDSVRLAGLPLIYLKFIPAAFATNPDMIRISPSIAPMETDVVIGRVDPDPYVDTELDSLLTEQGITQLLICGIYSTCCVDTTIRSSIELGYNVIVIEDGHGDHVNSLAAARAIQDEWMAMAGVSVIKLADLSLSSLCDL